MLNRNNPEITKSTSRTHESWKRMEMKSDNTLYKKESANFFRNLKNKDNCFSCPICPCGKTVCKVGL